MVTNNPLSWTDLGKSENFPSIPIKKFDKCQHTTLNGAGANRWKCAGCGEVIEFDKPKAKEPPATLEKAKRFINISAMKGDG